MRFPAMQNGVATFREKVWSRIDVYVWVLLLPLLLIGVGSWEWSRNAERMEIYTAAAAELPATLEELRAIAADGPMTMIAQSSGADTRTKPASMAVAEVEQAIPVAERGVGLARISGPLATIVIVGGAIAFLAGATGLLHALQAGRAARRSRDQLIASFSRVHRALPLILGALVVGLAAAILSIALFETIGLWFWDRVSNNAIKLFVLVLLVAATAVYGAFTAIRGLRDIFALSTPDPIEQSARLITEDEAPGLWRFVRDLARRQEALVPDAIIVGMDGGFYVTEHPVRLHPGKQLLEGRTLHIPAPYLEMLDDEELAGVIGHELAHFAGEDTAYSRHFSPIYQGLERALGAMGRASAKGFGIYPAVSLGYHMIERFDHAVKHWGRLRELEADRRSSLVSGPHAIARSLVRTSIVAPVASFTLNKAFQAPGKCEKDLVADMVALVSEHGWPDVANHLEDHAAHPTDTHPSTPHRIAALNLAVNDDLIAAATRPPVADASPGERLFADWLATRRRLTADFDTAARTAHAEHRAGLESAAAAVGDKEVEIYENVGPAMWVMRIAAGMFGAAAIAVLVVGGSAGFAREPMAMAILFGTCAILALAMVAFAVILGRRRRNPMMILRPDSVWSRRLDRPLPWLDIAAYQVSATNQLFIMFVLHEHAELPGKIGRAGRTNINRKKRTVLIGCYGARGYKPADLDALIDRYAGAAYARQALAEQVDQVQAA